MTDKQRIVDEKAELDAKIERLEDLINTEAFGAERLDLMRRQLWPMRAYSSVLRQHIELLGGS
jgi:hypothetical protein